MYDPKTYCLQLVLPCGNEGFILQKSRTAGGTRAEWQRCWLAESRWVTELSTICSSQMSSSAGCKESAQPPILFFWELYSGSYGWTRLQRILWWAHNITGLQSSSSRQSLILDHLPHGSISYRIVTCAKMVVHLKTAPTSDTNSWWGLRQFLSTTCPRHWLALSIQHSLRHLSH